MSNRLVNSDACSGFVQNSSSFEYRFGPRPMMPQLLASALQKLILFRILTTRQDPKINSEDLKI
ncbi:hypothetical protein PVV74_19800 [Roseovarius sp. SK2]|uniref:hypothetical protein n=1 Tax=Roseovarius TaxID=74030 RepID=UPI000B24925E|nr:MULTISPECIES: hypothetical protein [Roseovarius]MDD9727697.1 hypothetical protein [Roseovarius sp. SK2]